MKKIMALMVGLLVLGAALAAAQETTQAQEKAQVQTQVKAQAQAKTQTKAEFRFRNRIAFIDEDGDGVNDLAKDSDGDGIPNCQDPDWTRPLDGSGYAAKHRVGQSAGTGKTQGQKAGQMTKAGFGKGSFRSGASAAAKVSGAGVCDGTGPKGTAQRKGRR